MIVALVVVIVAVVFAAVRTSAVAATNSSGVIQSAIDDVQAFWATKLPAVYGMEYKPIPQNRLFPYSESNPPPACGGSGTTPYKDVANNAFYCPAGDFLAWDAQGLIPTIQQQFGDFAVALVAAHELGHAIQERTGTSAGSTIPLELQADCFAGAWAQHATTTTKDTFNVKKGDLDEALSGYLYFRDPTGTDPTTEGAHGSAFDRISAFNDGFSGGVQRCKNYDTEPPTVTEVPYTSSNDVARQGNLPFSDLVKLAQQDLNVYWKISAGFDIRHLVRGRPGKDEAMRQGRQQAGRRVFRRLRRLRPRKAARGIRQVRRQRRSHPHGRSVQRTRRP